MVYNLSISTHIKKSLITVIFTNKENFCYRTKITFAWHTIISPEKVMFNSNYLNHLLQYIRPHPINPNSNNIITKMWAKISVRIEAVVLIEFAAFYAKKGYCSADAYL